MKTDDKGKLITEEQRKQLVEKIINYFNTERDEEIGVIAAEELMSFITDAVGIEIYNKGVEDTLCMIRNRFSDLTLEAEVLLRKD